MAGVADEWWEAPPEKPWLSRPLHVVPQDAVMREFDVAVDLVQHARSEMQLPAEVRSAMRPGEEVYRMWSLSGGSHDRSGRQTLRVVVWRVRQDPRKRPLLSRRASRTTSTLPKWKRVR